MRLKLEIVKLQDKYGSELVNDGLESVRQEMLMGLDHDVLGCQECWVDLVSRKYTYCPQSVYHPLHFAHRCISTSECACQEPPFLLV
jgi:hypothetical protein